MVSLHDSFEGMVHCPFCGKLSAEYINEEFIPNVCEHMLVFYADFYHYYISKVLLSEMSAHKLPISKEHPTGGIGDQWSTNWQVADLAGIVPYSIIFSQGLGSPGYELDVTVAYYPGGGDDADPEANNP